MKKNIIVNLLSVLLMGGFMVGCNDNIPPLNVDGIKVESISLKETLANGLKLEEGEKEDISLQVNIVPENATDRAETYYSSNLDVATVSQLGELRALAPGHSEITIVVGGLEVSFDLEVTEKQIIAPTNIYFSKDKLEILLGVDLDVTQFIRFEPANANDDIIYESLDNSIVKINEEGIATGLVEGNTKITARAKRDKTGTVKTEVPVVVKKFSGDYKRNAWTMEVSQDISKWTSNKEGNVPGAALDDNSATALCLVKPGKSISGIANNNEPLWFVVDMKVAQPVSYFKIKHGPQNLVGLRWHGFEKIEGRNDTNEDWTLIKKDASIPEWQDMGVIESPEISLGGEFTYRYIRFYATDAGTDNMYFDASDKNSVQIDELYLGIRYPEK